MGRARHEQRPRSQPAARALSMGTRWAVSSQASRPAHHVAPDPAPLFLESPCPLLGPGAEMSRRCPVSGQALGQHVCTRRALRPECAAQGGHLQLAGCPS